MSLEEALAKHTAAVERNTEFLEKLVARADAAGSAAGSAAAATDTGKGKGKAKGKETEADAGKGDTASTLTTDDVKKAASAWLGEFKGVEGDPETAARRDAIVTALAKLVGKEGAQIVDVPAADLPRVIAWIDARKAADKGFGVGRLTAPPTAAEEATAGDDEI